MGIEKFFGEKVAGFGSSVYDVSRGIGKNLVYGVAGLAAVCGVAVANPGDARGGSVLEEIFKGALVDQTAREIVKSGSDNGGANVVVNNNASCGLSKADVAILNQIRKIPTILYLGDIDGDNKADWAYYSREDGDRGHRARKAFKNKTGEWSYIEDNDHTEEGFIYFIGNEAREIPADTLLIMYKNPSVDFD